MQSIKTFLNDKGQIKQLPRKKTKRGEVLKYLASKFEVGRVYTEKEINTAIDEWHTFNDYFLLRRELIVAGVVNRTMDGSEYWLVEN